MRRVSHVAHRMLSVTRHVSRYVLHVTRHPQFIAFSSIDDMSASILLLEHAITMALLNQSR